MSDLVLKDLKAAKYNPRTITDDQLRKLDESIQYFGDLSGVVFNARTRTLISGHQRTKTLKKKDVKIVTQKHVDNHGTIRLGYIEAKTDRGVVKIPFRVVDWDEVKEQRANIAANAQGGKFDDVKLAALHAKLDKEADSEFGIELLGLDQLSIKKLKLLSKKIEASYADKEEESFDEINVDEFEFEHTCPKCQYQW